MALRLDCQLLRQTLEDRGLDEDDISTIIKRIESNAKHLRDITHEFVHQVPDFVWFGGIDSSNFIERQLGNFGRLQLENISVNFEYRAKDRLVFGSALIGEHIYNIFSNSRFAIAQAISGGEISKGNISIIVEEESNTSVRRRSRAFVRVTILDNGGGVAEDLHRNVRCLAKVFIV